MKRMHRYISDRLQLLCICTPKDESELTFEERTFLNILDDCYEFISKLFINNLHFQIFEEVIEHGHSLFIILYV